MLADWLRRRYETARVIVVALGLLLGGPLALWLLTIRDPALFQAVFALAFFCLSWYNGPMTAVIFDVVPSRISATVAGAYLLFIHLAGDAIAFPLVGSLRDRFGLDRAVLLLPAVVIVGGLTVLGAIRTVGRDMHRQGVERYEPPSSLALRNTSSSSSSYIASARSGSSERIASAAQCFRWLCSSDRLTPRSASCTDDTCISTSAQ